MKKLLLTLSFVVAAISAFAQGTVNFNNNVAFATTASRLVLDTAGNPLTGTNWVAQLYYGAQGSAEGSLGAVTAGPAKFRVSTTSQPGTWSGGSRTFTGFDTPTTVTLQVRVWDGSLFTDYASALAGGGITGKSILFDYAIPGGTAAPSAYFMEGLREFQLVPEPSVIALAVLGAGALLLRRRRK